ncbi:GNAT family N-acetyltransferase [Mesorhizobium sp. BR1-1-13]|uniref:GNAT family N-acetyltransferase n=1 Tax=Mesorhizobium sp. BR1-1-13 TaxID=2876656 RepID=UPI001CD106AC|nr:GNAT family N-acetyltransferase [Mesorhizobium sp. BR1-1-13]MBZ9944361.1 GNAT family N-acetyltransferase [Mesorhizobium sp. BR1-1-13]
MNAHAAIAGLKSGALEIVTSEARLAEVGPAWTELWRRAEGLIFQSHAWVTAWWQTAPDRELRGLRIGLIWNGDRIDAVIPLATVRRKGVNVLEWAAKDHSDYGDVLVAPDCDPAAVAALWQEISAAGGFDLVYLNRLLPDAAMRTLLAPASAPKMALRPNRRSETSFRVAGPWRTGADWFGEQTKKMRQNYRRGRKFLEEGGEVRFRLMSPDEPMQPVLDRLAEFKRKWLAAHGHESNLFDEGSPALGALVAVLAREGLLHVFVLECAGMVVAVSINFVQRNTMMAFVTTYDPDVERASPGMVLMMDYIQWSIDRGLTMVDFLCGGEDFKRRFATQSVTLDSVLGTRTLRGTLAALADRTLHAGRELHQRLRPDPRQKPAPVE